MTRRRPERGRPPLVNGDHQQQHPRAVNQPSTSSTAAAIAAGHTDTGSPSERPQYQPGYYSARIVDPDGHKVEAVYRTR